MPYDEDGDFYPDDTTVRGATSEVTIKIDYETEAFMEAVVAKVAHQYHKTVAKMLDTAISDKVKEIVEAEAEARIANAVESILRNGFQPTDSYGHPKGPRKTAETLILENLTMSDNYSRRGLPKIVENVVAERFSREIEAATKTIRGMVDGEIQERLNKALREALGQK